MTGIDIETIESQWQSLDTIQSEIWDFFWPDTILIGQNISFDIGFLKKFFPWCAFIYSIDTYPLAASSIPYLKSYSLESIDHHLTEKYDSYSDQKVYLLSTLSEWKILSAHDALYDCINWLCFIWRWYNQLQSFQQEFPIIWEIIFKTVWEWFINIVEKSEKKNEKSSLPILSSPLSSEKKHLHDSIINREKVPQHSKRSTAENNLQEIIKELAHPCIIAVSHGSKIDIIKKPCANEQFDSHKAGQHLEQ